MLLLYESQLMQSEYIIYKQKSLKQHLLTALYTVDAIPVQCITYTFGIIDTTVATLLDALWQPLSLDLTDMFACSH